MRFSCITKRPMEKWHSRNSERGKGPSRLHSAKGIASRETARKLSWVYMSAEVGPSVFFHFHQDRFFHRIILPYAS